MVLLDLSGACVIEHDPSPARWTCIRQRLGTSYRLRSTIVDAHGLITVNDRGLAAAISIRALGLQGHEVAGALILRGILVRHPRLHDLLQALALGSQLIHDGVLLLKGFLQIAYHALLNLLQLLDALFVGLADTLVFSSLIIVGLRDRGVVVFPIVVSVLILVLVDVQAMCRLVHFVLLILIVCLEASVG